jgi:predicted amidohydrolase YtcJ
MNLTLARFFARGQKVKKPREVKMPHADLIITNARIITMNPSQPFAQSMGVLGNRIIAIGSNEDVAGCKAKHTRMIDA